MKEEIVSNEALDHILAGMIQSHEGVSDLLFVAGKAPQVEAFGKLKPFELNPPEFILTTERIESLARTIIGPNQRLLQDLAESGSCDCSYTLVNFCRFRVNIYRQNGNYAMVLRRLQTDIPNMDSLGLAPVFREVRSEERRVGKEC